MNIQQLENFIKNNNQPAFRLKQIKKAIFEDGVSSFFDITTLSKDLREKLDQEIPLLSFTVEKVLEAKDSRSAKALLKLEDGNLLETVLISPKPGLWSVCISSQVGCPMACGFCATGLMGFKRNLTAEEITDQVLFWKQYLTKTKNKKQNIKNEPNSEFKILNSKFSIVYMGMGEPFLNWENVRESIKNLINPDLFGFGSRSISVSTSGVPDGIENLANNFPQVNLALSLHFADDVKRSEWMPVNRKYNLEKLRNSLRNYLEKTNRKVFVEYVMLDGVNDDLSDAEQLVGYLKSIGHTQLLHVNLIRYNITSDTIQPSLVGVAREFKDYLIRYGINATIRKSLGEEIQGACGQLAGKN